MNSAEFLVQGEYKFLPYESMTPYPSHVPLSTIERFRADIIAYAAENGCSVTFLDPDSDALIIDTAGDSHTFYMDNALIDYHNARGDAAAEHIVISTYIGAFTKKKQVDESCEARLSRLRLRVINPTMLGNALAHDSTTTFENSSRQLAPGIAVVVCEDLPEQIRILSDDSLDGLGSVEDIFVTAGSNTWSELHQTAPEVISLDNSDAPPGIYALGNGGYYLATSILMPDLLASWIPNLNPSIGWFFSTPTREIMFLAPITSGQRMIKQLSFLAEITYQHYEEGSHPISPCVYATGGPLEDIEAVAGPMNSEENQEDTVSIAICLPEHLQKLCEE